MLCTKLQYRVMAEAKDTEERNHKTTGPAQAAMGAARICNASLPQQQGSVQATTSQPPVVTDSEWLALSAEEQLAWAKNTQDPRIAVGSYSPLEKKIKSLGGTHSSRVRKLLVQEFQQESETLDKLKTMSFDFRFGKADTYYYQQRHPIIKEAWNHKTDPERDVKKEEEGSRSKKTEDAKKWDYVVSEREMNHIEKHIQRAERARGLRDHKYRLLPQRIPSEIHSPKTLAPHVEKNKNIQKTPKTVPQKPKVAWVKEQMKQHRDRMIRGRELTEQRNAQREAQEISSHIRPLLKSQVKKEVKEFEKVTAYPIFQPSKKTLIKVTILMEKSKEERIKKPLQKGLLSIPPFLRSQLGKKNLKLFS